MAIIINLLLVEKSTVKSDLTIKKVLKRLKAIKNKVSVYIEVILLLKISKF